MTPKQCALEMLGYEWSWLCAITLMQRAIDFFEETGNEHWAVRAMLHQFEALRYHDEHYNRWLSASDADRVAYVAMMDCIHGERDKIRREE